MISWSDMFQEWSCSKLDHDPSDEKITRYHTILIQISNSEYHAVFHAMLVTSFILNYSQPFCVESNLFFSDALQHLDLVL